MKYAGSDSWMKAPNGKDTKLTEKQWLQVRTPSFKAWFGDWEGDPESASKAVDENGEPLVVYHATDGDFWTFNRERLGKNTLDNASDEGLAATSLLGHWFNTQDLTQRKYPIGSRSIPAFLNIRTPDYAGSLDLLASDLEGYDSPKEAADEYLDRITDNDGIILRDTEFGGTSFVVFTSNQIKSATDNAGTFDPRNPSILFQQAYHGSPYGFDSFSTDAIGSGEGRQVFGWGLYFTDNRGIAEGYAKKLTKPKVRYKGEDTETAKRRAKDLRTAEEIEAGEESTEESMLGFIERMARNKASGLISDYKENIKELIKVRENILEGKGYPPNETQKRIYRKQIEALRNIDPEQIEVFPVPRNLYTVDIPDGDYIKWDGLLTEGQKRKIAEQARKEGITDRWGNPFAYEMDGEWGLNSGASSSGEVFYRMEMQGYFPDDRAKSLFLARAGIKGIDYPAGSLSGGAEGRNFVVFDAADVQVQEHILFQKAQDITAKIDEVIDAGKRKEHDKTEVEIGEVTDVLAENALLHGYDIRGYKHTLDNYFVQHVMKQHGNQKAETARGNIAITEDDIRRIPDILSAPDFIVYGSTARTGNKAITFIKAEAGSTVFVEEIRTGRKKLAGQTIYKIAGTTDASSIKKIPGLTSENGSDMIRIVDVKNELVNGESAENTTFRESPEGSTRLLFQQTEKELLDDAASFDSWQDFMEFYESFGKPEDSIVPSGADEAWYRTAWELARKRKADRETGMTAEDRDALFIREMEDGGLEDFLTETLHFYIFYVKYGCNVVPI